MDEPDDAAVELPDLLISQHISERSDTRTEETKAGCSPSDDHHHDAQPRKVACPFFDILSWDLRYYIYQLAFSGRVLHVYLLYRRGLQPDPRWRKGHAPMPTWFPNSPSVSPMDPPFADGSITPQWYWWNCVCGLDEPSASQRQRGGPDGSRGVGEEMALKDNCPRGLFQVSEASETLLGVMGWLRSCRRAYEETVRVLYAGNTFKLEQRLEALYFPHSLSSQQMSWITSLEVTISDRDESLQDPSLSQAPSPAKGVPSLSRCLALSTREQYSYIINAIGTAFPSLRRLHVAFEGSVRRSPPPQPVPGTQPPPRLLVNNLGEVEVAQLERILLEPLDALPPGVERQVLFYQSLYTVLRTVLSDKGAKVDEQEGCVPHSKAGWRRFWRSLDSAQSERRGYWVYMRV